MRFGTLLAERRTNAWQCTYKMGDEPGLFAVLNAPSIEVANETVAAGAENLELAAELAPNKKAHGGPKEMSSPGPPGELMGMSAVGYMWGPERTTANAFRDRPFDHSGTSPWQ